MREIKFRAWDGLLNFFVDPLLYFVEFDGSAWFNLGAVGDDCSGCDILVDQSSKLIVEQFTGLTDKNGVEIYEGDIIKDLGYDDKHIEIKWEDTEGCAGYRSVGFNLGDMDSQYEVVGNIHENPELLNGKH